jgi:hypothetical protein
MTVVADDGGLHKEGAELIRQAFEAAKSRGVDDWRSMTSAVLKNRILGLTDGEFDEGRWNADNFREFVNQFDDVIEVDANAQPPKIRLLSELPPNSDSPSGRTPIPRPRIAAGRSKRIRQDLWRAIVDSKGETYIWDGDNATKAVRPTASAVLPSLSEEEFKAWRKDFVRAALEDNQDLKTFLEGWAESGRGPSALTGPLRQKWAEELKGRVAQRLVDWFSENSIDLPDNFIEEAGQGRRSVTNTEDLRGFLIECIRLMNRHELDELRISPATAWRATRKG